MSHSRTSVAVVLAGSLLGCDHFEPSDEGQYWLSIGLVDQLGVQSHRVLVGSTFDVSIEEVIPEGEIDPEGGGLLCATSSASGSLSKIDAGNIARFLVESAGPGAVEFAPPIESCPANDDVLVELGPDRWSMIGVDASAAIGRWIGSGGGSIAFYGMSPGPAGVFPDAIGRPLDEARIAAGGQFILSPVLVDSSAGERAEIRWHDPDAFVTVPGHYQELATDDGRQLSFLQGSVRAGDSFDASITILANEFELPRITAVPTREITSLELIPVYFPSEEPEREWGLPAGVLALTRDGEGRRILAAPIEWSVTRGRVSAGSVNFGSDVFEVGDCRDEPKKPQWRGATVEAKLDDLQAAVDLEWLALPSDQIDPNSDLCGGSTCNCSTDASPGDSALAMFALLAFGRLLRRRHSSRRSAASTPPT